MVIETGPRGKALAPRGGDAIGKYDANQDPASHGTKFKTW